MFSSCPGMDDGAAQARLLKCQNGPFRRTNFSIAHRGAPLQFPEHTKEAYEAGARMGAGIVECDVTFTKDGQLVCRHDECDLHTTTNIVEHRRSTRVARCRGPARARARAAAPATSRSRSSRRSRARWTRRIPPRPRPRAISAAPRAWRTDLYTSRGTLLTLQGKHRAQPAARRRTHARAQGRQPGARQRRCSAARRTTRRR